MSENPLTAFYSSFGKFCKNPFMHFYLLVPVIAVGGLEPNPPE